MKKGSASLWKLVDKHGQHVISVALVLVAAALVLTVFLLFKQVFPPLSNIPLPPAFEIPPFPVSIAVPTEGDVVSGLMPVKIANPSGHNFQKIEFWVDRKVEKNFDAMGAGVANKLYEVNYQLDSRKYPNGNHVLSVRTVGPNEEYQTHSVTVRFAN